MDWTQLLYGLNTALGQQGAQEAQAIRNRSDAYLAPYRNYSEASKLYYDGQMAKQRFLYDQRKASIDTSLLDQWRRNQSQEYDLTYQTAPYSAYEKQSNDYWKGRGNKFDYELLQLKLQEAQSRYEQAKMLDPLYKMRVQSEMRNEAIRRGIPYMDMDSSTAASQQITNAMKQYGIGETEQINNLQQKYAQDPSTFYSTILGYNPAYANALNAQKTEAYAYSKGYAVPGKVNAAGATAPIPENPYGVWKPDPSATVVPPAPSGQAPYNPSTVPPSQLAGPSGATPVPSQAPIQVPSGSSVSAMFGRNPQLGTEKVVPNNDGLISLYSPNSANMMGTTNAAPMPTYGANRAAVGRQGDSVRMQLQRLRQLSEAENRRRQKALAADVKEKL